MCFRYSMPSYSLLFFSATFIFLLCSTFVHFKYDIFSSKIPFGSLLFLSSLPHHHVFFYILDHIYNSYKKILQLHYLCLFWVCFHWWFFSWLHVIFSSFFSHKYKFQFDVLFLLLSAEFCWIPLKSVKTFFWQAVQ